MNPPEGRKIIRDTADDARRTRIKGIWMSLILVIFLYSILFIRLTYIQVFKASEYAAEALSQRVKPSEVNPTRGRILDRNGIELAYSTSSNSIFVRPQDLKDPQKAASKLAPILGLDQKKLATQLEPGQKPGIIARKVSYEQLRSIAQQKVAGLTILEQGQRFYPKGSLAGQLIGFAGSDNQGLEGMEAQCDGTLAGTAGLLQAERDAKGNIIPGGQEVFTHAVDGLDVVLTRDENIQYSCEKHLENAVKEFGAKGGFAIAMDPITGELLAIATYPFTNPNDPFTSSTKQRRLTPITDSYEPGSTFKLIVAAAAIEEGLADLDDKFYDPGHIKVANATIRCWKAGGHGEQTLAEAMANSCNPVFSSLALKLGPEKFMHYVTAFGFGSKTGVDFPGEATGLLHSLKQFRVVEQATYAFGQGLSVTGLQLVSALSTIANGGTLMRPYLVKELRDLSGTLVKRTLPAKIRKVLSDATVAKVQKMLHDVTTIGSGTKAVPAGYKVAGKTGTAQKPEGGGYGDKRISSFMGYLPADDPKVAILVAIDEPSTENRYGGTVAAPVFQRIASDIMRYMEVAPSEQVKASEKVAQLTKVPDVIGTERARAAALLRLAGLVMAAEGEGTVATEMVPRPGTSATKGSAVMVYFAEQGTKQEKEGLESVVPDLRGKSLKSAAIAAGLSGFALSPEGSGIVYKQSPAPGGRYLKGTLIAVWLRTQ